jgi:hypothetical protein
VSDPVATHIDGFDALEFDVANVRRVEVDVIQQDEGTQGLVPRERDHWIAVDVHGTTVVIIESVSDPLAFDARQADLHRVVGSLAFDR